MAENSNPSSVYTTTLQIQSSEERLDRVLLRDIQQKHPDVSRASLKSYFQKNFVFVDGRHASPSQTLAPGSYEILIQNWNLAIPRAIPCPSGNFLPVLFEDEDLLILNKKTSIASVPHSPEETQTAVNSALAHYPLLEQVGSNPMEPGLLHRLDTGTSGVLAFAKNENEFQRIKSIWKTPEMEKHYRAVSLGLPSNLTLPITIQAPLAHDAKSNKKMIVVGEKTRDSQIRGKPLPAITHILSARCVRSFAEAHHACTDFHIRIETGVMHQIRCHLASLGYPIVGDPIYSVRGSEKPSQKTRLWLHAWRLKLPLKSGEIIVFEAPLPDGWPVEPR
jgi:23S rRNA pseudouridine1911/1915/1917 synthase